MSCQFEHFSTHILHSEFNINFNNPEQTEYSESEREEFKVKLNASIVKNETLNVGDKLSVNFELLYGDECNTISIKVKSMSIFLIKNMDQVITNKLIEEECFHEAMDIVRMHIHELSALNGIDNLILPQFSFDKQNT